MRISLVSYLNTLPFRFAVNNSPLRLRNGSFLCCPPSDCAQMLIDNKADIGLVPVAAILHLNEPVVFSDFCISAHHEAYSVLILSQRPLRECTTLLLDYQSRTSVAMCKILDEHFLHYHFNYVDAAPGFEAQIQGNTAGLVIGDRAMHYRTNFEHVCDVGSLWLQYTGLPAVFALWVANKPLERSFVNEFNAIMQYGIDNIEHAIETYRGPDIGISLHRYLTECLCLNLDEERIQSVRKFLQFLKPQCNLNIYP